MQVINIDVAGKQTFFCVGKQYDKNATVIYFRGLELSSGAQLYLTVGGTRYSLANRSFVINEHLTNLSGDYKRSSVSKTGIRKLSSGYSPSALKQSAIRAMKSKGTTNLS